VSHPPTTPSPRVEPAAATAPNTSAAARSAGAALTSAYCEVRSRTEGLIAPLSPEDQVVQSMPDASPAKWHRAHTTWFFEEFVLGPNATGYEPADPSHRFLFNSYYEAVGPRQPRPRRGMITRPSVDEITRYRRHVDAAMLALIDAVDQVDAADSELRGAVMDMVELGLNHEQQHQELILMDIKHLLFQNPLRPAYFSDRPSAPAPEVVGRAGWIDHPGGLVEVGHDGTGFAYDNERPRFTTYLQPFRIADRLVTSAEWLEFMSDGGYRRPELWLSDGWGLVQTDGWDAPLYWDRPADGTDADWTVFTLEGDRPVEPAEPVVHVSYHEADAFARWRGARLPTESEWEAVAAANWWEPPSGRAAVHPAASGSPGTDDLGFGSEVWQWTQSAYLPYPGFAPAPGAVGEYNGKFMVSQHVLRGGSCATPPGHSRPTYRNFFPPSARWAFSGVRLASDA